MKKRQGRHWLLVPPRQMAFTFTLQNYFQSGLLSAVNATNKTDIFLQTHGPYHRHKSTKIGKLYISAHYRNGVCTWPTLVGAKQIILTTAVSSFAKAQKMDNHTVGHYTIGVSTCPTLRGAKHFPSTSYFFYAWCVRSVHIFLLHKSNTDETQIPKQLTNNYCIPSPPYRSAE